MDILTEDKLRVIAGQQKKDLIMVEKDYFLTLFLYLIKDEEGLYFKGGTALNKIFLNHTRLSEDLDFSITKPLEKVKNALQKAIAENNSIFTALTYDKSVFDFTRYIVHYKSYFKKDATLFLDMNKRAKLLLTPEKSIIKNFYGFDFTVSTVNKKEIIAEKVLALINRNKPRDYFDVYQLIKQKIPIDLHLVEEKSKLHSQSFDITKIFSHANKIFAAWDKDLSHLTTTMVSFQEVMKTLAEYFRYAEEKEKLKDKKKK